MDRLTFEALKLSLESKNQIHVRVASDSMHPLLKVGETLSVSKPIERLKMFDLVVFFQQERLNCHFLWRDQIEFDNSLVTRSLKEPQFDDVPIANENVLGVVSGRRISLLQKLKIFFYVSVAGR